MGKVVTLKIVCPKCGYEKEIQVERGLFFGFKRKDAKKYEEVHCPKCKSLMVLLDERNRH